MDHLYPLNDEIREMLFQVRYTGEQPPMILYRIENPKTAKLFLRHLRVWAMLDHDIHTHIAKALFYRTQQGVWMPELIHFRLCINFDKYKPS